MHYKHYVVWKVSVLVHHFTNTFQDCADRIVRGIPQKKLYYYITWDTFIVGHLSSLCPVCFDRLFAQAIVDN